MLRKLWWAIRQQDKVDHYLGLFLHEVEQHGETKRALNYAAADARALRNAREKHQ